MGRPTSTRRLIPSTQEDHSIIRGAAILRTQIRHNQSQHRGSMDDSYESTGSDDQAPPAVWSDATGSGTSRSSLNSAHPLHHHSQEEDDNFSDPWVSHKKGVDRTALSSSSRVVTPTRQHDDASFGFASSLSGNGTFSNASQGQPVDWANQAMGEEGSIALSVGSRQPDTDGCEPLSPQRRKSKDVGVAQVATYNIKSMLSSDSDDSSSDEKPGYSFADGEDDEYSERGRESYLPREMRKSDVSKSQIKSSNKPSQKARILQLVTGNAPDGPPQNSQKAQKKPTKSVLAVGGSSDSKRELAEYLDQVVSPLSVNYSMLMQDPAFRHAQDAGLLWQSLVGSQIRFPSSWWNGERSPAMGMDQDGRKRTWQFFGRYPSFNPNLRGYVKHRSSPGRLLLHIVVQDLVTWKPVQDIVVGCFDPNSRGIRRTSRAEVGNEECRELFLAVRKRSDNISVIDSLLAQGRSWLDCECKGPLGPKQRITNSNVRAVFGEKAPVETIFIHESTLYERLIAGKDQGPPIFLVKEFVFS
mmetsp:Transcript_4887/g.10147  ORF Transcript_4887/g.10147 Transcript_4887/m.10147 type:complete len:527 (-) Transcript_4887:245-1825(-)